MSRRELFGSLCAMIFLVNFARIIFAPLLQPAAAEFEVTAASLGIVASAAWLGSAAPRLPTGFLLTYVPRHYVVGLAGTFLIFTAGFTGLSQSVAHLTVGAFLMGISSGMYFIAANPLISELFPDRIGQALGVHGMTSMLAAVCAPVVLSFILLIGHWRLIFGCIAVAATVSSLFFVWAAWRTPLPDAGSEDRSLLVAGRAQWPLILTSIAFIGSVGFLWNGLFNLYGDYLTIAKGVDPATGRLLLSGMFAAGVPAFLIAGRLADRLPYVPFLLGIATGFVICVLALTLVEGLLLILIVSLFVGFLTFSLFPVVDTYILTSLPDRHRGSAYALFSSTMMFVQSLGSGTVGLAVARGVSYTATFQVLSISVFGVIICLFILYHTDRLPAGGTSVDRTKPV